MRLVDADALKEDCRMANDCKDCKTYVRDCEYDRIYTKMDFCGWIDDAPTVDAVQIIRCGSCKYYDGVGYCALHQTEMCETDFCSYGKKDGDYEKADLRR